MPGPAPHTQAQAPQGVSSGGPGPHRAPVTRSESHSFGTHVRVGTCPGWVGSILEASLSVTRGPSPPCSAPPSWGPSGLSAHPVLDGGPGVTHLALSLKEMSEVPGGPFRTFWEPVYKTSMPVGGGHRLTRGRVPPRVGSLQRGCPFSQDPASQTQVLGNLGPHHAIGLE